MVELKEEIKFPSGVIQYWEIEGKLFEFEFAVEVKEFVFPSGYKKIVVKKAEQKVGA